MSTQIIIFHSESDKDIAKSLKQSLSGVKDYITLDFRDIVEDIRGHIESGQNIFLLIISPQSDEIEISTSLQTAKRFNVPLIPILVNLTKEEFQSHYKEMLRQLPQGIIQNEQKLSEESFDHNVAFLKLNLHDIKGSLEKTVVQKTVVPTAPSYRPRIFISVKSYDYEFAKVICNYLQKQNNDVFLAPSGILDKDECANYAAMIDSELERSTHMLLIISNPKDINSRWVRYEWFTYHYEMTSGRKKNGSLHIVTINKKFDDLELPIRLRGIQQTIYDPSELSIVGKKFGLKESITSQPSYTQKPPVTAAELKPLKPPRTSKSFTFHSKHILPIIFVLVIAILTATILSPILMDYIYPNAPPSKAEIEFTQIPPLGTSNLLIGRVTNMSPAEYQNHKIAVYIYVNGQGWWGPKPYSTDTVMINPDGTWHANIVTGGYDAYATRIAAILVPSSVPLPFLTGIESFPPYEFREYPITYTGR